MTALSPTEQVVKIVKDELTAILGSTESKVRYCSTPPTVYMIVGLQGSGKTTSAGKPALWLSQHGHKPLLVSVDVYRPAARDQLKIVAGQIGQPIYDGAAGEIVRRRIPGYTPYASSHGLWERARPDHLDVLEAAWKPYLEGGRELDAAIEALVDGLAVAARGRRRKPSMIPSVANQAANRPIPTGCVQSRADSIRRRPPTLPAGRNWRPCIPRRGRSKTREKPRRST